MKFFIPDFLQILKSEKKSYKEIEIILTENFEIGNDAESSAKLFEFYFYLCSFIKARKWAKKTLLLDPVNPEFQYKYKFISILITTLEGEVKPKIENFLETELDKNSLDYAFVNALHLQNINQFDKSIETLEEIVKKSPTTIVLHELSRAYLNQDRHKESYEICNILRKLDPDNKKFILLEASINISIKNFEYADFLINEILTIYESNFEALKLKAISLYKRGFYSKALQIYNEMIDIIPNSSTTLFYKSNCELLMEKYFESIQSIDKAIKLRPDSKSYQLHKIKIFEKIEKAKFTPHFQNINEIFFDLGKKHAEEFQIIKSNEYFDKYIELSHFDVKSYMKVIQQLCDLSCSNSAYKFANEAVILYSGNPQILYARALLAVDLKELTLAKEDIQKLILIEPSNFNYNFMLASILFNLGELELAYDFGIKSELLSPKKMMPNVFHLKGMVEYKQKKYQESIVSLVKSSELDNSLSINYKFISLCQIELGNYLDTIKYCDLFLDSNEHDRIVTYIKSFSLFKLARYDEAKEVIDQIISDDKKIIFLKSQISYNLKNFEDSIFFLKKLEEVAPEFKNFVQQSVSLCLVKIYEKDSYMEYLKNSSALLQEEKDFTDSEIGPSLKRARSKTDEHRGRISEELVPDFDEVEEELDNYIKKQRVASDDKKWQFTYDNLKLTNPDDPYYLQGCLSFKILESPNDDEI